MNTVLRHLRRVALLDRGEGPSDGHLLEAFVQHRDETAFEVLLRRHAPMVWGVCQRILGNRLDAEDALQATFLVLVRKAAAIRPRERVGPWLWGVAYRTSLKARAMNAKRRIKEQQTKARGRPDHHADAATEELLERLDRALSQLPAKYRVPVVLCELEGRSRREVAGRLGLAEGTLSWRLAQAKKMLAHKLARGGAALSAPAVAAVLSQGAASADLSPSLLTATIRAGMQVAAGRRAVEAVSAQVAALSAGVVKTMLLNKLKVVALAVLLSVGTVGLVYQAALAQPTPSLQDRSPAPPDGRASQVGRPAPDDLASLRLEIEALRKELRATRDEVKALRAEVRGARAPAAGNPERGVDRPGGRVKNVPSDDRLPKAGELPLRAWLMEDAGAGEALGQAEVALRKLRQDPNDKQAMEALDGALKRLKERSKPPVQDGPRRQ
jgi:RNA polymerase sigma factor (sigma-70 family)